jgi:hypothetical protein
MRSPRSSAASGPYRFVLLCASSFVPLTLRREWCEEWTSELWYVLQESHGPGGSRFRSHLEAAAFCRGAFSDAVEIGLHHRPRSLSLGNPIYCLLLFFFLAMASFLAALFLPGAHNT